MLVFGGVPSKKKCLGDYFALGEGLCSGTMLLVF